MAVSPTQIQAIKDIIQKYSDVVMHLMVGEGKPSPKMLKDLGIPDDYADILSVAFQSGKFGVVSGTDLKNISLRDLEKTLSKIVLSPAQERALEYIKINTGSRVAGLSSSIANNIINGVITSNVSQLQGVEQILTEGLSSFQSRAEVATKLRDFVGDMDRDWNRVAHTEMWNAHLQGEAMAILNDESSLTDKGKDTWVFKRPAPNACAQCKKHYLESDGVTPKLFKLSELLSYGDNYGKKVNDWNPTLGTLHPNCMCTLSIMPEGYVFDNQGQLVPL